MATLQGHDAGFSNSARDLVESKRNLWGVGINFEMPLDFTLTRKLLKASRLNIKANDAQLERSSIKQELAWLKHKEDLERCAQSIVLLKELEDSQKNRLASEEKNIKMEEALSFCFERRTRLHQRPSSKNGLTNCNAESSKPKQSFISPNLKKEKHYEHL